MSDDRRSSHRKSPEKIDLYSEIPCTLSCGPIIEGDLQREEQLRERFAVSRRQAVTLSPT